MKKIQIEDKCLKVVESDLSGNLLVTNLLNAIYHKKLQTDGIAEPNKGSLNYSEQNKLSEGLYENVYHGDYEGMSVFVNATICIKSSLRQMYTALWYVLITQLLFY